MAAPYSMEAELMTSMSKASSCKHGNCHGHRATTPSASPASVLRQQTHLHAHALPQYTLHPCRRDVTRSSARGNGGVGDRRAMPQGHRTSKQVTTCARPVCERLSVSVWRAGADTGGGDAWRASGTFKL